MDKISVYFVIVTVLVIFYTGNSASTKKDDNLTGAQSAKANNFSELDLNAIIDECNASFRIDIEYIKSLNDSGSFPDETEKTPKCYMRCYFVKTGIMSEDGELNQDLAKIMFQGERDGKVMENVGDMIDKCIAENTVTCQCEKAYAFARCVMEAEIEKYENE